MDIFKLLTRSSKLSKSAKASAGQADTSLPSSGQTVNPHLFAHDENKQMNNGLASSNKSIVLHPNSSLGKRKRKHKIVEEIPAEVDFFATAPESQTVKVFEAQNGNTDLAERVEEDHKVEDLEEWKRILKSHKVKITVLSGVEPEGLQPESIREARKRKKKRIHDVVEKVKKHKSPLAVTRPLASFSQLQSRYGVGMRVVQNIERDGYTVPTEIQLAALPILLGDSLIAANSDGSGGNNKAVGPVDLLAVAPTGSGKTLAFLIPIMKTLMGKITDPQARSGPRALIVAPTRELAAQIVNECRKLAVNTGLKVTLIKKGMKVGSDDEVTVDDSVSEATSDETSQT